MTEPSSEAATALAREFATWIGYRLVGEVTTLDLLMQGARIPPAVRSAPLPIIAAIKVYLDLLIPTEQASVDLDLMALRILCRLGEAADEPLNIRRGKANEVLPEHVRSRSEAPRQVWDAFRSRIEPRLRDRFVVLVMADLAASPAPPEVEVVSSELQGVDETRAQPESDHLESPVADSWTRTVGKPWALSAMVAVAVIVAGIAFIVKQSGSSPHSISKAFEPLNNLGGAQPVIGHGLNGETFTLAAVVRVAGTRPWAPTTAASPGDTIQIMLRFENTTPAGNLADVGVGVVLPTTASYVKGTSRLKSTAYPSGTDIDSDAIASGGINVGNYAAGSVGYVIADLKLASAEQFGCGVNPVTLRGALRPGKVDQETEATAFVSVIRTC